MSRFGQRKKIEWNDEALDEMLAQVEAQGEALEVAEQAIEALQSEDREMSAEQNELAGILLALVKAKQQAAKDS